MSDLQVTGMIPGGSGTPKPFTAGVTGQQRISDAHARYMQAALEGRAFWMSVTAGTPSAYVGAAAGTPLIAVQNPANSGKALVPLIACLGLRAAASVAGQSAFAIWAGPSALSSQTQTAPRSALSGLQGGSAGLGFSNVALTGSTAIFLAAPLFTYYWATAAGAFGAPAMFDIGGIGFAAPGNMFAIGMTTVPASMTVDASILWEEVPYLP